MKIKGLAAAVFTILVWGVTFVNTKALLAQFSALEVQVLRYFIGYVAIWGIWACQRHVVAPRERCWKDECLFALMGLFGAAIYQLMENCAIHYTNASNVSILVCMCPLLTAVIARLVFPGHKLHALFLIGFVIAIAGGVMVSMNGISEFHFNPLGDFIAMVGMVSWAVYSNLVTVVTGKGYSQVFVIRRMFFWTLVFMLPFVFWGMTAHGASVMGGSFAVNLDAAANAARFSSLVNHLNLMFLGVFASALCFVLWNEALAIIGTVRCSIGLYFIPALTVIFAYLFLGETLTAVSAVGAVLILVGVIISGWKKI